MQKNKLSKTPIATIGGTSNSQIAEVFDKMSDLTLKIDFRKVLNDNRKEIEDILKSEK